MPRSARLTNIAAGLCGSFASRNNDLAGYWAIGKLRLLAEQYSQNAVSLDVLAASMQPPTAEFAQVLANHHRLLQKLASRSGVRLEAITAAHISVDFLPRPWPRAIYYKQQWGEQFLLTVTISADGRTDGIISHAGYCRPHDPNRESRRSGA
jgi:hypothetical protein